MGLIKDFINFKWIYNYLNLYNFDAYIKKKNKDGYFELGEVLNLLNNHLLHKLYILRQYSLKGRNLEKTQDLN